MTDPARAGSEGFLLLKYTSYPKNTGTGLNPAPQQAGRWLRGAPWAPTQAPLTLLQHDHGSAVAGRRAPAFPAPVPAAGCFLPPSQRSGKAFLNGGNRSQLPAAAFLPTHHLLTEKWVWGASRQHRPADFRASPLPANIDLTSLGNEGVQLVLFV